MNFQPLHDYVLIKREEAEEQTKSGIYMPTAALEKTQRGEVIAVGFGTRENGTITPVCVTVGTKVLFSKYAGDEIKVDDQEYVLIREVDILAVVND